jgi:hypothetical protein
MSYVEVHVWNRAGVDFKLDLAVTYGSGSYEQGAGPWPEFKKGNMFVVHANPDPELQFGYIYYEPSGAIYKFRVTIHDSGKVDAYADGPGYASLDLQVQRSDNFARVDVFEAYHSHLQPERAAAAKWSDDRFDVFAIGPDSKLVHSWVDDAVTRSVPLKNGMDRVPGFHPWETIVNGLGGVRNVSVCAWEEGRLDVVAVHDRWGLSHIWWDGAEFETEPLELPATPGPEIAVVAMDVGHLEVIATDTTNQLYRRSYSNSHWSTWSVLGRDIPTGMPMSAARVSPTEVGIFVKYDDALGFVEMRLDVATGDLSWPIPTIQGDFTPFCSAVTSWAPGRTDLFVLPLATPKLIQHRWRDDVGAPWSGPEDITFPYVAPSTIAACSSTPGHLDLLALSSNEIVELRYRNGWQPLGGGEWTFIPYGFSPPW